MLLGELIVLTVGFLGAGDDHDGGFEVLVEFLREKLEGKVAVLGEYVSGKVVVTVLAVQEEKVSKGLGGEGGVREEVVELRARGAEGENGIVEKGVFLQSQEERNDDRRSLECAERRIGRM